MKGGKLLAFAAGVAAGATALFLSKEENRKTTKEELAKVADDPKAALESGVEKVSLETKKAVDKTSKAVDSAVKKTKKKAKKAAKSTKK